MDLVPVLPGIDAATAQFNYRNGLCVVLQPRRHRAYVINARKSVLVNYEAEVRYTPRHMDSLSARELTSIVPFSYVLIILQTSDSLL